MEKTGKNRKDQASSHYKVSWHLILKDNKYSKKKRKVLPRIDGQKACWQTSLYIQLKHEFLKQMQFLTLILGTTHKQNPLHISLTTRGKKYL